MSESARPPPLSMLVSLEASINIVSAEMWENLKCQGIICTSRAKPEKRLYADALDTPLKVKGTFSCDVECGQHNVRSNFTVIEGNGILLLGIDTPTELGVLNTGMDVSGGFRNLQMGGCHNGGGSSKEGGAPPPGRSFC